MEAFRPAISNHAFAEQKPQKKARTHKDVSSSAPRHSPGARSNDRQAQRIKVTGWAHIQKSHLGASGVRINELSAFGFSIFLDFQLLSLDNYHLQLSIFRHGKTYSFDVKACCIYITLASDRGFRHGFEFGTLEIAAEDAIRDILESHPRLRATGRPLASPR